MKSYLYRACLVCGAIPLITGVAIFLLWWATRADWLMLAGVFTVYGGVIVASLGLLLALYISLHWREKGVWLRAFLAACLILVNIPICMGIIEAAIAIETRYVVTVSNDSDIPIERFTVTGPGVNRTWSRIEPGESVRGGFHFSCDGNFEYEAMAGEWQYKGAIEGYVTNGLGGEAHITFTPNREIEGGFESVNWKPKPEYGKHRIGPTEGETDL